MHSWLKVSFSLLLEIFVNFKKTCVVKKCQRDFDEKILNLKKEFYVNFCRHSFFIIIIELQTYKNSVDTEIIARMTCEFHFYLFLYYRNRYFLERKVKNNIFFWYKLIPF